MKIKFKIFLIFALTTATICSCEKWIDVQPKTEIRENIVFSSESGFREALNGVYAGMTTKSYYGKELTWGLVDVIGGVYDLTQLENYEVDAETGDFNNSATESIISEMWNSAYYCIANANNLLSNIETASPGIFKKEDKSIIKGEALGLRALLHFDILRLFGPAYQSNSWNEPILPYVIKYGSNATKRINGNEFILKILEDLNLAEDLLENDPIHISAGKNMLRERKVRINYYTIKALKARVYMWIGDRQKALASSMDVINNAASKFSWTKADSIQTQLPPNYDYILSSENIFSLYVNNLESLIVGKLKNLQLTASIIPNLSPYYGISEAQRQEQYEMSGSGITDYRSIYMIGTESIIGLTPLIYKKLHQDDGFSTFGKKVPFSFAERRIPIIKISELYYIAAECLIESNPSQAVTFLNTVRSNRGISTPLPATLTPDQIRNEILKEYRKEFPCEGQLFFYYKRTLVKNYTFPLPEREKEYGI